MIQVLAISAALFSLAHLVCLAVLFKQVSGLPLRDELFRKNIRRPGYAFKSELLLPQAVRTSLSSGGQVAVCSFALARVTALIAFVLGVAAVCLVIAGLVR